MSQTQSPAVGTQAPDLTLKNQFGEDVTLSSFRGTKNVLLVFYPFAFSGICTGELCEIRDDLGRFQDDDVQVLAISCDPMFTLRAWAQDQGYEFPLLSDFWPHGKVAQDYGVFLEGGGLAKRGTFLVDKDGTIAWALVNEPGERREFAGYHEALAALRG
ncbi:peroxiredoxin [Arsenicicoccus dermatophilus]|uniref:peroxiredoxin n=1 Tax=Arsenicicoccus dermatophilus TaxID=1076331 RepID=UPI001F4CAB2E|nr:peroxiredoxin [Arsenicicoccus dermatophilus]MCH8612751.1 peroxiredoxin [Arsenicicoccus dermatophilus]